MLIFQPWRKFNADVFPWAKREWLERVAKTAENIFKAGVSSSKSGRVYGKHRASAPGEYPAKPTGKHFASISSRVVGDSAIVGSGMFYARFLRNGTRKMARRQMSDTAMKSSIEINKNIPMRFAGFRHV